jgi:hypothetical protein
LGYAADVAHAANVRASLGHFQPKPGFPEDPVDFAADDAESLDAPDAADAASLQQPLASST